MIGAVFITLMVAFIASVVIELRSKTDLEAFFCHMLVFIITALVSAVFLILPFFA